MPDENAVTENASATSTPETTPVELTADEAAKRAAAEVKPVTPVVMLLGMAAFLYRLLIWQRLPGSITTKWWITIGVVIATCVVIAFSRRKKSRYFEALSNYIIILFVITASGFVATYFAADDRTSLLKLTIVAYFAFLPAWLYLQFLATRGKTVWEEYVLNLFRLHVDRYAHLPEPPRHSCFYAKWQAAGGDQSADNIYKKKFEALYGPAENLTVYRAENMFPVALATLIIAVGWLIVVDPPMVMVKNILGMAPGLPRVDSPLLEALRYGFLGAYFYVLQMLVRRYFQNDLRTHAYVNATMRIIVVLLLVWVACVALPSGTSAAIRYSLAFVIGVFPQVGWQVITETIKLGLKVVVKSLEHPYPLSNLDGLSVWYESRLLEEGIEDMQNLATCNLVDTMLNTRIPIERLVDWVDQSLLTMHMGTKEEDRQQLRTVGIRGATDLQDAYATEDDQTKALDALFPNRRLRIVLKTLQNEPNLYHVRQWKLFAQELEKDDTLDTLVVTTPATAMIRISSETTQSQPAV